MITLSRFLLACGVALNEADWKIHLAYRPGSTGVLDDYLAGRFQAYQAWQTRRNFECDQVVGLVRFKPDRWIFAGVWKIIGGRDRGPKHYHYDMELLPGQEELLGRVVVCHERTGRQAYLRGRRDDPRFTVASVLEEALSVEEFPGYRHVSLSYSQLQTVVTQSVDGWRTPLSSVKGIYVITDQETGCLYVGSATGDGGLWQRWRAYAKTGHGGNRELRLLLREEGHDYATNFRFTVLEVADLYATKDEVLERESYWKDALGTREHGYNAN
jgi:hypothetical protein